MKAYDTSFLLHANLLIKKILNPNFDQKLFLTQPNLRQNFSQNLSRTSGTAQALLLNCYNDSFEQTLSD